MPRVVGARCVDPAAVEPEEAVEEHPDPGHRERTGADPAQDIRAERAPEPLREPAGDPPHVERDEGTETADPCSAQPGTTQLLHVRPGFGPPSRPACAPWRRSRFATRPGRRRA